MISKNIYNLKMVGYTKTDILNALSDKNISGIGVVHNSLEGIQQKSVWAFPEIDSSTGIQIENKPICRGIQSSNLNKQIKKSKALAYFNNRSLEILLRDIHSSYIHFIHGEISFGYCRFYNTFFAFPSEEGIPYRLDMHSMKYIKPEARVMSFRKINPLLYQTGDPLHFTSFASDVHAENSTFHDKNMLLYTQNHCSQLKNNWLVRDDDS